MAELGSNYAISVAVKNLEQIAKLHIALKDIQSFATGKDMQATLRFDTKDEGRITTSLDKIARRKKEIEKPLNIRGTSGANNIAIDTKQLQRVFSDFTTKLSAVLTKYKQPVEPRYLEARKVGESYKGEKGRFINEEEYNRRVAENARLRQRYEAAQGPPDFATFNRAVLKFDDAVAKLVKRREGRDVEIGEQQIFAPKAGPAQEGIKALQGRISEAGKKFAAGIFTEKALTNEFDSIIAATKDINKHIASVMKKNFDRDIEGLKTLKQGEGATDDQIEDVYTGIMKDMQTQLGKGLTGILEGRKAGRKGVTQSSVQKVVTTVARIDQIMASFVTGLQTTFDTLQSQLRTLPNQIAALSRIPIQSHIGDINQAIEQSTTGIKRGIYGKPVAERAVPIDDQRRAELETMVKQLQDIKIRGSKLHGAALEQYEKALDPAFQPILQGLKAGSADLGKFSNTYVNNLINRIKQVLSRGTELFAAGSEAPIEGLRQEATRAYMYGPRGSIGFKGESGKYEGGGIAPTISGRGIVGSKTFNLAEQGSTAPFTAGAIEELKTKLEELNNVKLVKLVTAFQALAASSQTIAVNLGSVKGIIAPALISAVKATTLANLNTTTGVGSSRAEKQRLGQLEIEQKHLVEKRTELKRAELQLADLGGSVKLLDPSGRPIVDPKITERNEDRLRIETRRRDLVSEIEQIELRIKALQTPGTVGRAGGVARIPKLEELFQQYATLKQDPNADPKELAALGATLERKTGQARLRAEAQMEAEVRRKQVQVGESIVREEALARKRLIEQTNAAGVNEARREAERRAAHAARMAAEKQAASVFAKTLGYGSPTVRESTGFEGFRELLRKRIGQLETAIQRNNILEQRFSTNAALGLPQGKLEQQRVGSFVQIRDTINETLAVLRGAVKSGTIDKVPEGIVGAGAERYRANVAGVKEQLQTLSGLEQRLRTRGTPENTANRALGLLERLKSLSADEQLSDRARQIAAQRVQRVESSIQTRGLRGIAEETQVKTEKAAQAALSFANNMAVAQKNTKNFVPFIDSLVTKVKTLGSYVLVGGVLFNLVFKMREFVSTIISAQAELVRIEQILGRTSAADRGLISKEAFEQARKYGIALKDILNTVKLFAQSGFTLQQSLKLSEAVAQAAVGGGLEPQQAVETAIAVQNLSQGRTSATDIFGRIAKIERINAVTGQDLSLALQRVGSLATQLQSRQVGSVDAFDAVIGATTQIVETTRVTGNQAATSLRFILARLAAPDIARKLQDRFDIKLASDAEGQTLRPLTDILSDIATKYKELTGKEQTGEANRLLVTLAGARQVNAAAALLTNFNQAIETAVESSYAFGDIERRTAAQLETLQSKLGQLNNAIVGFVNNILERSGILGLAGKTLGGFKSVAEFGSGGTLQSLGVLGATAGIATIIGRVGNNILRNPEAGRIAGRISEGIRPSLPFSQPGFKTLYQHSLSQAALQGAQSAVTGGIIARTIAGLRQSPLLTTVDPNAAVVAQGGATVVGRVLQAFGLIGKTLGPIAIILTVTAGLNAFLKLIESFKKVAEFKIPTQKELLTTTDFGKQYQETANTLGVTITTLQNALSETVKEATATATAEGLDVNEIIAGRKRDPRFRRIFEQALITGTTARIPEIETLAKEQAGPGADKVALDQARANIVLGLFRDTARLLGGPAEAVNVELKKRLEEFMGGVTEITFERLQNALESTSFGVGKLEQVFDKLPDSLTRDLFKLGDFFANDVFGRTTEGRSITTRRIVEDENLFRQVFRGAAEETTVGERLDLIFERFYERNPQKRRDVEGRLRLGLQAALGIGSAQEELDKQQAKQETGTPGAKYLDFIRTTARKVLREIDTGAKTTVAGAELLKKVLAALFSADNATKAKLIIDTINQSLASIRDRVAEIVGGFAKQMQEISTVAPRFARAGIRFDAGGERLSAAQTALRSLAGVEGQIRLDLLKEHVRLESVRRSAERANVAMAGAEALDAVSNEGVGRFVAGGLSDLIAAGRGLATTEISDPEFVTRQKARIQSIRDSLFAVVNDRELLTNVPEDILKEFDKVLEDIGVEGDISGASLSRLLNLFERITALEQKRLVTHQKELVALQAENALRTQLLDIRINSQAQELQSALQIADAYRKGSGVRLELAQIELERSASIARAAQARISTRSQLIKESQRTGGVVDQEALARADAEFYNVTQTAPAVARAKEFELILRKSSEYVVAVLAKMNESIDSATSGLVEVLSSYEAFTNGQQIKTILQGFANTYLRNQAQNIQQSLFGQGGLLRSPLEKIFEQQAIDSQAAQLAATFSSITNYRLGQTFETGAEVLYRRIVAALGGEVGPGPRSVSTTYGGGRVGPILTTPAGPVILGGMLGGLGAATTAVAIGSKTSNIAKDGISPEILAASAQTGIPVDQLMRGVITKNYKTNKMQFNSKQLLTNATNLVGTYGGAALGGVIGGRGVANSYAGEGAALGTALGSAFIPVPVVGGLIGGAVGGLFGGLFGKGDGNKPPPELQSLERIERAQRDTITAIENQTRQLLSLDNRLLNVPASFTVPGYRPLGLQGGGGTVVINVDARGAAPGMEVNIENAVRRGLRAEGTYTDFRY